MWGTKAVVYFLLVFINFHATVKNFVLNCEIIHESVLQSLLIFQFMYTFSPFLYIVLLYTCFYNPIWYWCSKNSLFPLKPLFLASVTIARKYLVRTLYILSKYSEKGSPSPRKKKGRTDARPNLINLFSTWI